LQRRRSTERAEWVLQAKAEAYHAKESGFTLN
jgi:hypothetical protein